MLREQPFYRHKAILWKKKIKGWLLTVEEIYEPKLVSSKYLKNIT